MKKNILKGMAILTTMAICLAGCGNSSSGSGDNQGAGQDTGDAADAAGENEGAAAQDTDGAADAQSGAARGKVVFAYWGAESENRAIQAAVDDFRANHPENICSVICADLCLCGDHGIYGDMEQFYGSADLH